MAEQYSGADVLCPCCGARVPGTRLTAREIIRREAVAASSATGVDVGEILGTPRGRAARRARWNLWSRLREQHRWSNSRIARLLNVDPTTVLFAFRALEREEAARARQEVRHG